jgi:hypothetical protein
MPIVRAMTAMAAMVLRMQGRALMQYLLLGQAVYRRIAPPDGDNLEAWGFRPDAT